MSQRLLVTVLGTNPKPARYALAESSVEASLAPLALVQLLAEERRPTRILALCTAEAKEESWPILERGCSYQGIEARVADLGADPSDLASFLQVVACSIPVDGVAQGLMIDVTHGPRHYALLTYLAIQYLAALRGIAIDGAYYGWYHKDAGRLLDIRPLLVLPEWIYALRVFGEAGDASRLAGLVERGGDQVARAMATELRQISEAHEGGLPIELGQTSSKFRAERSKPFKKTLRAQGALLEDELWRRLEEPLGRLAFDSPNQISGWKKQVPLNVDELKRQAVLVDDLLDRGSIAVALGVMNEWTVSRVVLQMGKEGSWLNYDPTRRAAATRLGALGGLAQEPAQQSLSEQQRALGCFWRDLSELRNAFHHHGMRAQILIGSGATVEAKLAKVREYWGSLKTMSELPLALATSSQRLLVSPVGRRQGVLFSAIEACHRDGELPDACLVLVSDETSSAADEALHKAGFGGQVHRIRMADPYGGQSEIERLVQDARSQLVVAQEIAVNLTGGTTLMGLAVAAIANEAQRLGRNVRRFGLVDRRPPSQQDVEPYRASEAFWLDARSSDGN